MSENHRNATATGAAATYEADPDRAYVERLVALELGVDMQGEASNSPKEIDRLPAALDELYPLPTRVPDDLNSLINAVLDSTRRRSQS